MPAGTLHACGHKYDGKGAMKSKLIMQVHLQQCMPVDFRHVH